MGTPRKFFRGLPLFPNGLKAFHDASDLEYESITANVVAKATEYETELGTPFKDAVTNLRTTFVTAKTGQTAESGDVDAINIVVLGNAHALQVQLTDNVYVIGQANSDGPAKYIASTFFDQSLLFGHKVKKIYKGTVNSGITKTIFNLQYEAFKQIYSINLGGEAYTLQMQVDGVSYGNSFTLQPGEIINKHYNEFYVNGTSLILINASGGQAKYKIEDRI